MWCAHCALVERRGILLVCVQCWYELHPCCIFMSHEGLINGAHKVPVCGGSTLKFVMVQHVECNARRILACDTKIVCNRY
jgi:hypothetical protein